MPSKNNFCYEVRFKNTRKTDVMKLDLKTLEKQRELILHPPAAMEMKVSPFHDFTIVREPSYKPQGNQLLKEGKVGCVMLAGGQGTRLGFSGPKGMFPISPADNKTLFHLFAEKIAKARKDAGSRLPVALMTSPENHEQTVRFFEEHALLEDVDFFMQTTLPILDERGQLLLDSHGEVIQGPDGNGAVFEAFIAAGVKEKWQKRGIEVVNFAPVDNPLADPFDPELIGYLDAGDYNLVVKAIFREDPKENVGVLVKRDGRVHVVEYTELPIAEKEARDERGILTHRCANITLLALRMKDLNKYDLPLHLAHKAISEKNNPTPLAPNAWKFEKFIFDIFPLIERIGVLVYPRRECFAPLKNLTGPDSVETVQKALEDRT